MASTLPVNPRSAVPGDGLWNGSGASKASPGATGCCSASGFDAVRRCKLLRRRNIGGESCLLDNSHARWRSGQSLHARETPAPLRLRGERRECATAADRLQAPASSSIRSAMRCAPARSCSMVQSTALPPVTSRGRALLTSRPVRLPGSSSSCSATAAKHVRSRPDSAAQTVTVAGSPGWCPQSRTAIDSISTSQSSSARPEITSRVLAGLLVISPSSMTALRPARAPSRFSLPTT